MIAHIDTPDGVTVFFGNVQKTVNSEDPLYFEVMEVLESDYSDEDKEEELEELFSKSFLVRKGGGDFEDREDGVFYKGRKLHNCLAQKVQSMINNGVPNLGSFDNFVNKLFSNPSQRVTEELYDFLSYKELPITPDGDFLAYKKVGNDYWSKTGNTETIVLQGEVDDAGRILNKIGAVIEIARNCVDDNRNVGCSTGAHAGSFDYAKSFGGLGKMVICKINPQDVVSVPSDYSFQKLRACKYKVVGEVEKEFVAPVVEVSDNGDFKEIGKKSEVSEKIQKYLENKRLKGVQSVKVRQVQNSFKSDRPTVSAVLRTLDRLGFDYDINEDYPTSSVIFLV